MKSKYARLVYFSLLAVSFGLLAFPGASSIRHGFGEAKPFSSEEARKRFELARNQMRNSENDSALENLLSILDGGIPATDVVWGNALSHLSRMRREHSPSVSAFLYLHKVAQNAWEHDKSGESLTALFELNHYGRYEEENLKLFGASIHIHLKRRFIEKGCFECFGIMVDTKIF